jgi:hypothetical protein
LFASCQHVKIFSVVENKPVELNSGAENSEDFENEGGLSPIPGPSSRPNWIVETSHLEPENDDISPDSTRDLFSDEDEDEETRVDSPENETGNFSYRQKKKKF